VNDVDELREGLEHLRRNPAYRARLAANAQQFATAYLTAEAMARQYLDLLEDLRDLPPGGPPPLFPWCQDGGIVV
jgi:glycosyltransferase involved in cell wall biosynthesis